VNKRTSRYITISIPVDYKGMLDTIVADYKKQTGLKVSYAAFVKKHIEQEFDRITREEKGSK